MYYIDIIHTIYYMSLNIKTDNVDKEMAEFKKKELEKQERRAVDIDNGKFVGDCDDDEDNEDHDDCDSKVKTLSTNLFNPVKKAMVSALESFTTSAGFGHSTLSLRDLIDSVKKSPNTCMFIYNHTLYYKFIYILYSVQL